MKTEQRTVYITDDGREFLNKDEALDHEIRDSFFTWITDLGLAPTNSGSCAIATELWENRDALRDILHRGPAMHITPQEYAWLMARLRPRQKPQKLAGPLHGAHVLSQIKRLCKGDDEDA